VVSIISILLLISVPTLNNVLQGGQRESGINAITTAVTASRAYAGREIFNRDNLGGDFTGLFYRGTGILFTPGGHIRLLENDQLAEDSGGTFLQKLPDPANGYRDLPDRDDITLPAGAGVLGIVRVDDGGPALRLLAPPFALRFTETGQMTTAVDASAPERENMVFYDGDMNGEFDVAGTRPSAYDPDDWDPRRNPNVDFDEDTNRYHLPFEAIETVLGVLVFSRNNMPDSNDLEGEYTLNDGSTPSGAQLEWLLESAGGKLVNSTPLFFSRQTGAPLRETFEEAN